ncbi:MAG TPA: hypothetical protein VF274_07480, partial [Alphaproteobacteria bacterium]
MGPGETQGTVAAAALAALPTDSPDAMPWYRRRGFERALSVLSPVAILVVWELGAQVGIVDVRFFPAPSRIFEAFFAMLQPTPEYPRG